ncbi:MAG TPA: hypothetical protein VIG06_16695 [Kofleriaceae bacterium]|jgi:hypothetical protein
MLKPVITVLALVLAAGAAVAQPGRTAPARPGAAQADKAALKKRIRAMRVWYLTEELELDDATAARLFPVLGKYDDQLEALQVEGARLRRELRQGLGRRRGNQVDAARLVDALLAHYDKVYQLQRERIVAARKVLSAAQTGRLILVMPRVDNAIRRQIGRVMRGQALGKERRGRARRGMSPDLEDPYADDGDDDLRAPRKAPAATSRRREPELQHPF